MSFHFPHHGRSPTEFSIARSSMEDVVKSQRKLALKRFGDKNVEVVVGVDLNTEFSDVEEDVKGRVGPFVGKVQDPSKLAPNGVAASVARLNEAQRISALLSLLAVLSNHLVNTFSDVGWSHCVWASPKMRIIAHLLTPMPPTMFDVEVQKVEAHAWVDTIAEMNTDHRPILAHLNFFDDKVIPKKKQSVWKPVVPAHFSLQKPEDTIDAAELRFADFEEWGQGEDFVRFFQENLAQFCCADAGLCPLFNTTEPKALFHPKSPEQEAWEKFLNLESFVETEQEKAFWRKCKWKLHRGTTNHSHQC